MKKVIEAISFLHKNERLVIKATSLGKFRVPVTEVVRGDLKTRTRSLSARQIVEHEIIKNCDPTLYLPNGEKVRVFQGGDPSYLPAHVDGIIMKHDEANKPEMPKLRKTKDNKTNKGLTNGYNKDTSYRQASIDMYGWYPGQDDGFAD